MENLEVGSTSKRKLFRDAHANILAGLLDVKEV
jgi:hypothetical protein